LELTRYTNIEESTILLLLPIAMLPDPTNLPFNEDSDEEDEDYIPPADDHGIGFIVDHIKY